MTCRAALFAIGALFAGWCSGCSTATSPVTFTACGEIGQDATCHTMVFGGVTRAYLLHVPATFHANTSALVVALHGSNGSGLRLMNTSGLNAKSDQAGFAVAYPFALVSPGAGITEWNEYFNHSFGASPPDDAGFLRQLIVTLQAQLNPDPKQIYVTGLSNGGFMAHRAAIDLSDLIAAIGVVEGTVVSPGAISDIPNPAHPVSIIILHGDQDPTVPCCSSPPVASQEETFNYWSGPRANSCATFDTTQPICDAQLHQTALSEKNATGCLGNTEVKFYRLQGGAHLWYTAPMNVPGQTPYNPTLSASTGITTNDILWNFFASHPKP
jgi:polyhydroxybutyrate depolymerase